MTLTSRDHNATSYSTETEYDELASVANVKAEIITLRAIALKQCDFLAACSRSS